MSKRKKRKDIDKAVEHLMSYARADEEWASRIDTVRHEQFWPVIERLELSQDEVEDFFFSDFLSHMTIGYIFEECATTLWDGETLSLIGQYLKQRGWRDAPIAQRYLKALDQSDIQLWEVVGVKPGVSIDVRLFGTKGKVLRVKEKLASESVNQWDGIAARVFQLDGVNMFSGAMLPYSPIQAKHIQDSIDAIPENAVSMMQELIDEGKLDKLPEDMDAFIRENESAALPGILFQTWAINTYSQASEPLPEMMNMDDEPIEPAHVRFPILGERKDIVRTLDESPSLEADGDDIHWIWIPDGVKNEGQVERYSVLGHIELGDGTLRVSVNSAARADRGGKLLASLLKGLVGEPLTVHENLIQMLDDYEPDDMPSDLHHEISPEVEDVINQHLKQHYMQTLDESVPMLNGKTPRQCAADPELKQSVIQWIKYLENANDRSDMKSPNLDWMWHELNLVRE